MKNLDTKAMAHEAHVWWVRRGEHLPKVPSNKHILLKSKEKASKSA
jgi:hypothetical protein